MTKDDRFPRVTLFPENSCFGGAGIEIWLCNAREVFVSLICHADERRYCLTYLLLIQTTLFQSLITRHCLSADRMCALVSETFPCGIPAKRQDVAYEEKRNHHTQRLPADANSSRDLNQVRGPDVSALKRGADISLAEAIEVHLQNLSFLCHTNSFHENARPGWTCCQKEF